MGPPLSVTTPVYNGAAYVHRCYFSLDRQTFTDWEWVVVDDGSTDGTSDLVREIARNDPRVRLLRHAPNRGRGYARMAALNAAAGEWMVVWDIDDFFFPRRLECIDQARRDGQDFWCSNVVVVNTSLRFMGVRGFEQPFLPHPAKTPTHGSMACDMTLARQIGYRADLRTYGQMGEDVDIIYRLALRHRGVFEDEALMVNMVGHEVVVQKAIDSRRVKLDLWRTLYRNGELDLTRSDFNRLILRQVARNAVLRAVAVCPRLYPAITRFRMRGDRLDCRQLSSEQQEFLDEVRERFGPGKGAAAQQYGAVQPTG
jgi:glycosyltransferase involved in cell wall biosynthesis